VGAAGRVEEVGELRDDIDVDTPTFVDDAGIEALVAPVTIQSGMYHDYYDTYGALAYFYIAGVSFLTRYLR
jgi:hypothetical protein